MSKHIIIVGGVAAGASCAARLRRLDERARITVLERGAYASFANCGLPYYVGNVIEREESLLVVTPTTFRERFNIDVKTEHEVVRIDPHAREVEVVSPTGRHRLTYDALVLAPGAAPVRPSLPGVGQEGVFSVRTLPDSRRLREWIQRCPGGRAVIVGAGFIGLEMAENLQGLGMDVAVLELATQVLPPLDPEMAAPIAERLQSRGIHLHLGDGLAGIDPDLAVRTQSGARLPADVVVLALGVRPETTLAVQAGIALGARGGIRVDDQMRTSDPHIWAVGDVVEVRNTVTGEWGTLALAGPANRQGRVAADSIVGRPTRFRGVQGTAVVSVLGLTAGMTGASEKTLQKLGRQDYAAVYLHPGHHAGYYPGARKMSIKLLFQSSDGRILGAQAVGEEGVDKRIDVIATALQMGGTVFDLEECELAYAPQFGSAKDPVNLAGMIAANHARGDLPLADWEEVFAPDGLLLDVRNPSEVAAEPVPEAVNIPLGELRGRLGELPRERRIRVLCGVGQRAYYACRLLLQHGFRAALASGGYRTYRDWARRRGCGQPS